MILSVVLAVVFYALVILAVGYILNPAEIIESQQGTGLVTADVIMYSYVRLSIDRCTATYVEHRSSTASTS